MPLSMPHWSISREGDRDRVVRVDACSFSGTSLNMYSAGNSNSSFDSRSLVWRVMKAYVAFMSSCGKPIIVSMIPMSVGMPISCPPGTIAETAT